MSLIIQNGFIVGEKHIRKADISIENGKIQTISEFPLSFTDKGLHVTEEIDAAGSFIFPGFIDAHTHFGLGGVSPTADDFFNGSLCAAYGGITTFIDFADQEKGQTLRESAESRIKSEKDAVIDFTLHQGLYTMHADIPEELSDLRSLGIRAVKLFTTYKEFGVCLDETSWDEVLSLCKDLEMLVTVHAEDDEVIEKASRNLRYTTPGPEIHALFRPAAAEYSAVRKAGNLAMKHQIPLYIVHLSSAEGLRAVRELREMGAEVIVETTPHYLFLNRKYLEGENGEGSLFLMTPPLRDIADNEVLQQALTAGEIDIVATDHCAFTRKQKSEKLDCREIPFGIPGSEELSRVIYSCGVENNRIDLVQMMHLLSAAPAKVFGMYPEKGSLLPGTDADITIFTPHDPEKISFSAHPLSLHSNSGYSVYDGFTSMGKPSVTILRGKVIIRDGNFTGHRGLGKFVPCGTPAPYRNL
ncbi:MAG: amidohydrolase family protein [Spirochaetes bacterium]|nr:amidohydrolase family protein [Spirochaetota bacterium]